MKIQTVKIKLDIIAIIIAGLAMMGTVANACFNWWDHLQREKVLLDVTCEPMFDELVEFRHCVNTELMIFFNKCVVTNMSSKKVYITKIGTELEFSGVDVGVYDKLGMGTGGKIPLGYFHRSEFVPDETGILCTYNKDTQNLKQLMLPIVLDGGEELVFFVRTELPTRQKMTEKFNKTFPEQSTRKFTLREIFENMYFIDGMVVYGKIHHKFLPKQKDVLDKIKPIIRIYTSTGLKFEAKDTMIYIVKKGSQGI